MSKLNVLVTGATGFIGGRIVEIGYLSQKFNPIAAIHNWSSAARIGRFPVNMVQLDVLNKKQVYSALENIDVVVHCAYGGREATVKGTENIIECSKDQNVKHIIHLSTVEVYNKKDGDVDETTKISYSGNNYADMKVEAEKICWSKISENDTPITIFRPAIVYGPFSKLWTINICTRLNSGYWGKFKDIGNGICNLIYIDDLVNAIYQSFNNHITFGKAYNINGPDKISWNEYFELFNNMLGLDNIETKDPRFSKIKSILLEPVRGFARYLLKNYSDQIMKIYTSNSVTKKIFKTSENVLKNNISFNETKLFNRKSYYPNERIKVDIGYKPKYDVKKGLDMSIRWLKHHDYI